MPDQADSGKYTGVIAEYESLRAEILKRQQARDVILGSTLAGLGVVLGLLLDFDGSTDVDIRTTVLLSLSFILLIGAILFTIHQTQQIDVISGFIRNFIEPNIVGIRWESHWTEFRKTMGKGKLKSGLPMGTSKYFARYYLLLSIGLGFLTVLLKVYKHCWSALILYSLLALCGVMIHNLYYRWSRGWKFDWSVIRGLED